MVSATFNSKVHVSIKVHEFHTLKQLKQFIPNSYHVEPEGEVAVGYQPIRWDEVADEDHKHDTAVHHQGQVH